MTDDPTAAIAAVLALGVAAQWVATQLKIPSILLLLGVGLAAGPGLGLIDPDALMGDLLFPVVSLGVGLLLFEGGLGLHRSEIGAWGTVLVRLLTVGVLLTGLIAGVAAVTVGGLPAGAALIFGAIMTVTGPTVVTPLLRQYRLRPRVARILRWEGICVDAIGATLAIVVLEVVVVEGRGPLPTVGNVAATAGAGIGIGLVFALAFTWALGRRIVPDHMQNAVLIMGVVVSFAIANAIHDEAGLFAATALGIALGNQGRAPVRHVVAFQESLGVLLIGGIFVLLAARVEAAELRANLLPGLAVLAVLVLVARPLSVLVSTWGSTLPRKERVYLACLAPRGIVAASVSALFGLKLDSAGIAGGGDLAAITFVVVAGSVVVYGLAAGPISRRLRINVPDPSGVALVGAPPWAVELGAQLQGLDVSVLVVATDEAQIRTARHADLLVYNGRLVHRHLEETIEAVGVRLAVALSDSEELNAFGVDRFVELLGRANVYELPRRDDELAETHGKVGGGETRAFGAGLTGAAIAALLTQGAELTRFRPDEVARAGAGQVAGAEGGQPAATPVRYWPLLAVAGGKATVVSGKIAAGSEWLVGLRLCPSAVEDTATVAGLDPAAGIAAGIDAPST